MKNLVFIAPPAAGKGTESELLVKHYDYEHISTGDLLRDEVKKGTELGKTIDNLISKGKFVSDEIVSKLLVNKLSEVSKPFILDGYPRNLEQVKLLDDILKKVNKSIDVVIYLDVPYEILLKRTVGRLMCKNCGSTFNEYFESTKPKKDFICDKCGEALIKRSDDNEQTFKVRYDTFIEVTEPIKNYYEQNGLLKIIGFNSDPLEVFKEIESVIKW